MSIKNPTWSPALKLNSLILGEMAAFTVCCMTGLQLARIFSVSLWNFFSINQQMCINNIDNKLDATKRFINNSNQLNIFRATISPIFRSTRLCFTACGIMHRRCCRPVAWKRSSSTSRLPTGKIVGALYHKL